MIGIYLLRKGTAGVCLWSLWTPVYNQVKYQGNNIKITGKTQNGRLWFCNQAQKHEWMCNLMRPLGAIRTEKPCVSGGMWLIPVEMKSFPLKAIHKDPTCGRLHICDLSCTQIRIEHTRHIYKHYSNWVTTFWVIRQYLFTKHTFLRFKTWTGLLAGKS